MFLLSIPVGGFWVECFISKRNLVFLKDGVVIKRVSSPRHACAEAALLNEYYRAGVCVPRVFERRDNEVVMEYIFGDTIPDFLARIENEENDALLCNAAQGLCRWFECFYETVNHTRSDVIRGDVNGRNFIIAENRVVSVDFEECAFGTMERDIGRLLAFIKTYDLTGTYVKNRFAALFYQAAMENLRLSESEILRQYRLERTAIKKRRS